MQNSAISMPSAIRLVCLWLVVASIHLIATAPVLATTLNRVVSFQQQGLNAGGPIAIRSAVQVDTRLFFINGERELWVTDGSAAGTSRIYTNAAFNSFFSNDLVVLDNRVYGLRQTGGSQTELWMTDGTDAGTQRAIEADIGSDLFGSSGLILRQGLIFLPGADNNLVITDGTQEGTTTVPVDLDLLLSRICVIDQNHFFFPDENAQLSPTIMQYRNGNVEELDFSGEAFRFIPTFDSNSDGNYCYYPVIDEADQNIQQLLQLGRDGSSTVIQVGDPADGSALASVLEFDGRLFASVGAPTQAIPPDFGIGIGGIPISIGIPGFGLPGLGIPTNISQTTFVQTGLYEINAEQATAQQVLDAFSFVRFAGEQVYVGEVDDVIQFPTFGQPLQSTISVLDRNFQLLSEVSVDQITNPFSVSIVRVADQELLIRNDDVSRIEPLSTTLLSTELRIPELSVGRIVTAQNGIQQALYVFGSDRANPEVVSLYQLQDKPMISERLNGTWIADGLDRQGLIINSGINAEGRRYLFTSLFVFLEGQPFWLAGNDFFEDGIDQLEIELLRFSGLEFIAPDPDAQAVGESVGRMIITTLGCDRIRVELNLGEVLGVRDLEFTRLADRSFGGVCQD